MFSKTFSRLAVPSFRFISPVTRSFFSTSTFNELLTSLMCLGTKIQFKLHMDTDTSKLFYFDLNTPIKDIEKMISSDDSEGNLSFCTIEDSKAALITDKTLSLDDIQSLPTLVRIASENKLYSFNIGEQLSLNPMPADSYEQVL